MAYHFTAAERGLWPEPVNTLMPEAALVTRFGAYGVDMFFVLSGYVILMANWDRRPVAFARARVARLYPTYWSALAVALLVYLVLWPGRSAVTVEGVAANVTMLQTALGFADITTPQWTLWVELRFYLVFGCFLAWGATRERLAWLIALWAPIAGIAERSGFDFLATVLVAPYAPLFACGMGLYAMKRWRQWPVFGVLVAGNAALACAWPGSARREAVIAGTHNLNAVSGAASCAAVLICVGVIAFAANLPAWGWLSAAARLAGPSYALYLVHEPLGGWVIHILSGDLGVSIALAGAVAASSLVAWMIWRFVDRPAVPALRRLLSKRGG
jgi:peptidoglycan/LPS O-acetylase OafA/YrhL